MSSLKMSIDTEENRATFKMVMLLSRKRVDGDRLLYGDMVEHISANLFRPFLQIINRRRHNDRNTKLIPMLNVHLL